MQFYASRKMKLLRRFIRLFKRSNEINDINDDTNDDWGADDTNDDINVNWGADDINLKADINDDNDNNNIYEDANDNPYEGTNNIEKKENNNTYMLIILLLLFTDNFYIRFAYIISMYIIYIYNKEMDLRDYPFEMDVSPFDISFSQRIANSYFKNGVRVESTIEELVNGLQPSEIKKIRCCYVNSNLHSLDNRRLHCFQEAIKRGANFTTIPVQVISMDDRKNNIKWKMEESRYWKRCLIQNTDWTKLHYIGSNAHPGVYI